MEFKLDGLRSVAIKFGGKIHLRSRNDNDFNTRYPAIVKALAKMPEDTVIDGEVVALDEEGRPSFNTLQKFGSADAPLHFFSSDLLILEGRDVMSEPLTRLGKSLHRVSINQFTTYYSLDRLSKEIIAGWGC